MIQGIPEIDYLTWAKARVGRLPWDLRRSGIADRSLWDLLQEFPVQASHFDRPELFLLEALAARLGATPDQLLLGGGTSGANFHALQALLGIDGGVLCESPSYQPLWSLPELLGRELLFYPRRPERGWEVDPLEVEACLGLQTRVVLLSRPHNPTGVDIPETTLIALGEMAEAHDIYVMVDEVYLDFLPAAVPAFKLHPRLVSTSSFTKVYGLGPLRMGWMVGAPELIRVAALVRDHVEVHPQAPTMALTRAIWPALDRFLKQALDTAQQGRAVVDRIVQGIEGLRFSNPPGGLIGFLSWGGDDQKVSDLLEVRGVGVTPGSFFRAPGGVRVAWGRGEEITSRGLIALREVIQAERAT